jgi:hypothetical protein
MFPPDKEPEWPLITLALVYVIAMCLLKLTLHFFIFNLIWAGLPSFYLYIYCGNGF